MMNDRRQHDPIIQELLVEIKNLKLDIQEHAYVIKNNRTDLDGLSDATKGIRGELKTHVGQEAVYWKIVEDMKVTVDRLEHSLEGLVALMNDLAGLGRLGSRIGRIGKWFAGIGGFAAMFYFVWDWMVDHIGKN
jgi:hypothetical protein